MRKLNFVAVKLLSPLSEPVQPVFLLMLIYVYRPRVILSLLRLPRSVNPSKADNLR